MSFSILSSKGIFALLFLLSNCAIFPASVCSPMAVTTPFALPLEIYVPAKSIFFLSGIRRFSLSLMNSASLCTSMDSPVSRDSSTRRLLPVITLTSAATLVPGSKRSISPVTTSLLSISCICPFLRIMTFVLMRFCSSLAFFDAEYS